MEQRVRFGTETFIFTPPTDWQDWTEYAFRNQQAREVVTVGFETLPPEARSSLSDTELREVWMAQRRETIAAHLPEGAVLTPTRAAQMGNFPALWGVVCAHGRRKCRNLSKLSGAGAVE